MSLNGRKSVSTYLADGPMASQAALADPGLAAVTVCAAAGPCSSSTVVDAAG
jgi:hypothetical protein